MTFTVRLVIPFIIASLMLSVVAIPRAQAHEGVDHSTGAMHVEDMEKMIALLQQLVILMTEYKATYGIMPATTHAHVEGDEHDEAEHAEEEEEDEHDAH